jgi:uncharacterized membrane protein
MATNVSKHDAILIFILSLFCLVPYLNLFVSPIVCYFSNRTLKKIKGDPKQYGGRFFALIAFIISIIAMALSYPVLLYQQFF